jgi:hypothetical protein
LEGIYWEEGSSILSVAQKIEVALKASRRQQEWLHDIVSDTIVIVTGCHHIPEIYDRPSAYELKTFIDYMGRSVSRTFLHSVVMGDIWCIDRSDIPSHRNIISVGSPALNRLTEIIAGSGKPVRQGADGQWHILRDENRWALFGNQGEDTYNAISSFKDRDLPRYLGEIWSHL